MQLIHGLRLTLNPYYRPQVPCDHNADVYVDHYYERKRRRRPRCLMKRLHCFDCCKER